MSPRARTALLAAMAAGATAATSACGAADTTKSGARGEGPRTMHWDMPPPGRPGVDGNFQPIFHGRTPFLPGDGFIVWGNLPGGGHEHVFCVIASQEPRRTFWCTRTYVTPTGQIVAAGVFDGSPRGDDGPLPVVGGTGAYAGARGTATDRLGRHGGTITIRLR